MATREPTFSDTHEPALTQILKRAYMLNWEVIAYGAIFVVAMLTRFVDLGARVMSHDESLHTYYSWRLYEFGEFNHTPLMHGPLLFLMTALSYFLFGDSDFTSRIYPAFLGVMIVLFPLLFRRWLGRVGAMIASILLLISPQMLYYSRYIRHDIPTIFFALVMLYAILQYIDGVRPRQSVWIGVLVVALIGMLASKEVSFIYIALWGSLIALFWFMRVLQDVGIQQRPADDSGWDEPRWQLITGHLILLFLVGIVALVLGGLLRFLFSSILWIPSGSWLSAGVFVVLYFPLALWGMVRKGFAFNNGPNKGGAASAIMHFLSEGRSALYIIIAGAIIGALVALLIVCVIDVIRLDQVWTQTIVRSENDSLYGANQTKEYATSVGFNRVMLVRLLTWTGLPVLLLLFVIFLTAVFKYPGNMSLPWREIMLLLLVAFIVAGVLVMVERRSFVSETALQPFAADPNAPTHTDEGNYNVWWLVGAWLFGAGGAMLVSFSRYFTDVWDFLNRQPIFDLVVVIVTMILPWAAAVPLYLAGYNLEEYNFSTKAGKDMLVATGLVVIPFFMLSISIGLSWNWRLWLPAYAVFLTLFAFLFTTIFSYPDGLVTGMIGSLGYWLEQQGVRRGSQPQYYYVLTQLSIYEFLPMLGAMLAGITGLSSLWGWRHKRAETKKEIEVAAAGPVLFDLPSAMPPDSDGMAELADAEEHALRLFRSFDPAEEAARCAVDPEWVGSFPLLGLLGYWAIMIVLALTLAGEKMPWLTTHLTIPLILITGWWLGRVVTQIRWKLMQSGEWLVLLVLLPAAFMMFARVVFGFWGKNAPFQSRTVTDLLASGNWLAAILILIGIVYLVGRFGIRLGYVQLGRMALASGALVLALLTARSAYMASYVNYDYATEYLVYAHAGPAVKTVLEEIDQIAQLTNENNNMRIVFDDESSWPYTWYFRDYPNYGYLRGEAGSVDPASLDGARVVVVGNKKSNDVRRMLGDRYYEMDFIRLWWPMQEYFGLNYNKVANMFSLDADNIAARYYRAGLFDIWWDRDYSTYAQAMCIDTAQFRCEEEARWGTTPDEQRQLRATCEQSVVNECVGDDRFDVNKWPVSDRMYFFVDKQIAAQVWDAGIGSSTVNIRDPEYPEDQVYREIAAENIVGELAEMVNPRGIVVDEDGTLYIADTDHSRIVVLGSDAADIRSIGDPALVENGLRLPWGLDLGPDSLVYVADTWNNRVAVFTKEGDFVRAWGQMGTPSDAPSPDAMWGPRDLKIGPDGNVYVADTGGKRIRVYTSEGQFIRDIGSSGAGLGQLDEPVGLAFNPVSGELYVAEAWNKRIHVFDAAGLPLRTFEVNMWFRNRQSPNRPYIAVNSAGTLIYVTDMDDHHRVVAYNLEGVPIFAFNHPDDLEAGVLGLRSPAGMAFDQSGRLYVVDVDPVKARVFIFPPSEISVGAPPLSSDQAQPDGAGGALGNEPDVVSDGEQSDTDQENMPENENIEADASGADTNEDTNAP